MWSLHLDLLNNTTSLILTFSDHKESEHLHTHHHVEDDVDEVMRIHHYHSVLSRCVSSFLLF